MVVLSRSFSKHSLLREELVTKYESVRFNDSGQQLSGQDLIRFIGKAEKIIVGLENLDEYVIAHLPNLRVVAKYGVGLDGLDLAALRQRNIRLGWTPGVNKRSVSELVLFLTLALLRRGIESVNEVAISGGWTQNVGSELTGKTFGIIGCGNVGQDLVRLIQPFQCRVFGHDIAPQPRFYQEFNVRESSMLEVLQRSDVVSVHLPLTPRTRNLIARAELKKMNKKGYLINTSRGNIVNENDLHEGLCKGWLKGAASDVFSTEPPICHDLISLPNFIPTPHIGGTTDEAILAMGRAAIRGLDENEIP